jgi:hypothetical protein
MPFEEFSSTYLARSSVTPKSEMTAPATPASVASPDGARCGLGRMFRARLIQNPGSAARGDLPRQYMMQRFITNKAAILPQQWSLVRTSTRFRRTGSPAFIHNRGESPWGDARRSPLCLLLTTIAVRNLTSWCTRPQRSEAT